MTLHTNIDLGDPRSLRKPLHGLRAKLGDTRAAGEPKPAETPQLALKPSGATILVADDNYTQTKLLAHMLKSKGYRVVTARDGQEALALLRRQPVDLIISDVVMPGMDGYALLRAVRGDPALAHLPVIFLSGYATADDRRRAKESGVEDYLTKPLEEPDLLASLSNLLERQRAHEAHATRQVEEVRDQILGLMQHELRTPLTFIMGYAELLTAALDDAAEPEEMRPSVEAILDGSRRLHQLIESFLALATVGRRTLNPDELYAIEPIALWREVVASRWADLESAQLHVAIEDLPDPVMVQGVVDLLREALLRLLDNAIRYRHAGKSTIWLAVVRRPGLVGWLIRDEGIGISPQRLAQILPSSGKLPTFQSTPGMVTNLGNGMSLYLTQRIAQLHGGYLTVDSVEGKGSTFGLWVADTEPTFD
jgi:two-component system, sensor histidine kinase and response regulator